MVKNRLHAPLKKYHGKITESELGATKKKLLGSYDKKIYCYYDKKITADVEDLRQIIMSKYYRPCTEELSLVCG
jgi:hypothetical protein